MASEDVEETAVGLPLRMNVRAFSVDLDALMLTLPLFNKPSIELVVGCFVLCEEEIVRQ